MHCYETEENMVEDYFYTMFLICEELIFGLVVLEKI